MSFDFITSLYLLSFLIGFLLSGVSFLFHAVHTGGADVPGGGTDWHGDLHGPNGADHMGDASDGVSLLNFSSITMFLTWFGGVGFGLRMYGGLGLFPVILLSVLGGILGAYIVYLFLTKILLKGQTNPLRSSDFYLPGTIARVSSQINAGGAGEIVYSLHGTRHTCGAKAVDNSLIPQGSEVMIFRFEKGIAYVKPWTQGMDPLQV